MACYLTVSRAGSSQNPAVESDVALPPPLAQPARSPHYCCTASLASATTVYRRSYDQFSAMLQSCTPELQPVTTSSANATTVYRRSYDQFSAMLQPCTPELQRVTTSSANATTVYHRSYDQFSAMPQPCTPELQPTTPSLPNVTTVYHRSYDQFSAMLHPCTWKLQLAMRRRRMLQPCTAKATTTCVRATTVYAGAATGDARRRRGCNRRRCMMGPATLCASTTRGLQNAASGCPRGGRGELVCGES